MERRSRHAGRSCAWRCGRLIRREDCTDAQLWPASTTIATAIMSETKYHHHNGLGQHYPQLFLHQQRYDQQGPPPSPSYRQYASLDGAPPPGLPGPSGDAVAIWLLHGTDPIATTFVAKTWRYPPTTLVRLNRLSSTCLAPRANLPSRRPRGKLSPRILLCTRPC